MGKHDFLSPKAISNRIKSKGLQKLRWYCQVCEKQCRDENGFKCHTTSESHQRQMLIVARNANKFISGYSKMFEEGFLDILRRRHGTKRVKANGVYNEYIAHKEHIHMNSTTFTTLSSFVQYLGREGKCEVDETEKGWYIKYISRDPKVLQRQKDMEKKKKSDLDHDERNRKFLEKQIQDAAKAKKEEPKEEKKLLVRSNSNEKIQLSVKKRKESTKESAVATKSPFSFGSVGNAHGPKKQKTEKRRELDTVMEEQLRREERKRKDEDKGSRKENWIRRDLIVKILNKDLDGGKMYKKKGVITDVREKFIATVEILDTNQVLDIDQDELETVIPKPNRPVCIVNGIGRGAYGILKEINADNYCARVVIETGSKKGLVLDAVEYEDFCKISEETFDRKVAKDSRK